MILKTAFRIITLSIVFSNNYSLFAADQCGFDGKSFYFSEKCYRLDPLQYGECSLYRDGLIVNGLCYAHLQDLKMKNSQLISKDACQASHSGRGLYLGNGICVSGSASAQISAILANRLRYSGGNELSHGDGYFKAEAKLSKILNHETLKELSIEVSIIPKDFVNNYAQKSAQNYHNNSRFRSDGYLDEPWFKAKIETLMEYNKYNRGKFAIGIMETNGLKPLKEKASEYYMTAPYGLTVRYDKAISYGHEIGEEVSKIVEASFGISDGDGIKGESSVSPEDSRGNSYPSYFGSVRVDIMNALKEISHELATKLDGFQVYIGVTGAQGDAGSYAGEKRRQNDFLKFAGVAMPIGKDGKFEVRVFDGKYDRNIINDGNGKHSPAVKSDTSGIELAFSGFHSKNCDYEVYYNLHQFHNKSDFPDGEFTFGDIRSVRGWNLGQKCKNWLQVKNFDLGVEVGRITLDNPKSVGAQSSTKKHDENKGYQFNLNFSYKFQL